MFWNRREFLKAAGIGVAAAGGLIPIAARGRSRYDEDKLTPYEDVTGYNNYYEFGTDKGDPAKNATHFKTRPWKVEVAGEVKRPAVYDFDELLKPFTPVERVYRHRCVEARSMVVPWLGIPRGDRRPAGADLEGEICRVHHSAGPGSDAGATAPGTRLALCRSVTPGRS